MKRLPAIGRWLLRWAPFVALALPIVMLADEAVALAQSTGGSFGGGSFGGGGGGYSGGGSSSGGDDGEGIVWIVMWIVSSRLPWPLKLGLVGLVVTGWAGYRYSKRRANEKTTRPPDER